MRHTHKKTAEDLIAHFQKRCMQRIGIILNQRQLKELMCTNKMHLLVNQSRTRKMYHLHREDWNAKEMLHKDVVVVYDNVRHAFVTTYLYDDWVKNHWEKGQYVHESHSSSKD